MTGQDVVSTSGKVWVVADQVAVHTSVTVSQGCEMRGVVWDSDTTFFVLGGKSEPADVTFDAHSLRRFIELAQRGLAEMDKQQAAEAAGAEPVEGRVQLEPER